MSVLVALDGPSSGKRFRLGTLTSLGGGPADGIAVAGLDPAAVQIAAEDHRFVARARRPFQVNGAEASERALRHGDILTFGSVRFQFRAEDSRGPVSRTGSVGAIHRAAAVLTGDGELGEVLRTALGLLMDETAAAMGAAYLADADSGRFDRVAHDSRRAAPGATDPFAKTFDDLAALQNAAAAASSAPAGALVLPLSARTRALGALALLAPPPSTLPDRDVEFATSLALLAGVAAENRRNARQMEEYGRLLMSIEKATMWLSSYLERDPILGEAVGFARSIFKASHVSIAEVQPDGKSAKLVRFANPRKNDPTTFQVKVGEGMLGGVLASGRAILSPDPATGKPPEGFVKSKRYRTDSFAIVPVFASVSEGSEIVGAISVADKIGGRPFNERDLELLAVLARAVGVALHNASLYERATVDSLTRLYVRQHFLHRLEELMARALRNRRPLSLAIADLDDFKQVNDRHGHPAGDAVLRAVGNAVKGALRPGDMGGRYGGEEFGVLIQNATLAEAREVCLGVLDAVRGVEVEGAKGARIRITASMGLAELRAGDTPESLVARADAAQYRAKYGGKNRLVEADR